MIIDVEFKKLAWTMAKNSGVGGLAVVLMVLGGYLVQWLQTDADFPKPIMITYTNTAALALLLVGQLAFSFARRMYIRWIDVHDDADTLWQRVSFSVADFSAQIRAQSGDHSTLKLALAAVPFAFLFLLANVLFIFGLPMTNVPSSMSLEQAATVFVYALSVCLLGETLTFPKVASVVTCIGGVIIIAFADQADGNEPSAGVGSTNPLLGDMLVLASTVATALYLVFFKRFFCAPLSLAVLNVFLGLIGVATLLLFWPVLVAIELSGFEPLEWPSGKALPLFLANVFETLAFNYVLNAGVIYVTPLFMRVSLICTIPLSFAIDLILHGAAAFDWVQLIGALFVIAGFVAFSIISAQSVARPPAIEVNLDDDKDEDEDKLLDDDSESSRDSFDTDYN